MEDGPLPEKSPSKASLLMASGSATAIPGYQQNTSKPRTEARIMVDGVSVIKYGI